MHNVAKRPTASYLLVGLVLATTFAASSPSHAALDCGATAYAPEVSLRASFAGFLFWDIWFGGKSECTSSSRVEEHSMVVALQSHSWGPFWKTKARLSAPQANNSVEEEGTIPCPFESTDDWRTVVDSHAINAEFDQDTSQDVSAIADDRWCPLRLDWPTQPPAQPEA